MSDSFTGYNEPNDPTKKLDAELVTTGAGQVHRQRVGLATGATVSVGNFPGTQTVDGTVDLVAGATVSVSNFPANFPLPTGQVSTLTPYATVAAVNPAFTDGTAKARILNSGGADIDGTNPLPVSLTNSTVNVTAQFDSIISTNNAISTPLGAGEVYTGNWEDVTDFASIAAIIYTDVASATNGAEVQFSTDGVTVVRSVSTTITANFGAFFELPPQAKYFRVKYTNGSTAQTFIYAQIILRFNPGGTINQPLGAQVTDANTASVTRSFISGRQSSGAWKSLAADGDGRLYVTDATTYAKLDALHNDHLAGIGASVSNFPANYPLPTSQLDTLTPFATVSLTQGVLDALERVYATVSNLPADYPLPSSQITTLTPYATVAVNNLPADYPLPSGQVTTLTPYATVSVSSTSHIGATVYGEVAVNNQRTDYPLPSSQVTTLTPFATVSVQNFPADYPLPTTQADSDFERLVKFRPMVGEELRRDETSTDDYHGAAPDGTLESAASWKVCRFYKDANGNITRVRYRTGVVWTDRAAGW